MAGVILLTAMLAGGISLWIKRRRDRIREELEEKEKQQEFPSDNS
ncbi:MAG: hypothetical protein R3230_06950 [Nitrosopumilaceae archaeon]|nr:hypothetical protein [Nitrosopumilaceae archaeon]